MLGIAEVMHMCFCPDFVYTMLMSVYLGNKSLSVQSEFQHSSGKFDSSPFRVKKKSNKSDSKRVAANFE